MKILLISPKSPPLSSNKDINDFIISKNELTLFNMNWSGICYGLLILAALTPKKHSVELVDENFDEIKYSSDYDLIVFSTITNLAPRVYYIADRFRKLGVKVVIGGIHATILPEEVKVHCDSVAIGEAEYLWPKILEDAESENLKPYYKDHQDVDLTIDSPIPRFDLLKKNRYKIIWIQTSRGCPHNCEFCSASKVFGVRFRKKRIKQIIQEIKIIKEEFGNVGIGFGDDNFLLNKKYSKQLLRKMIPLKIRWYALSDVSIGGDVELIDLMKASGCVNIFLGFESVSERVLEKINKNSWKVKQLKNYPKYVNNIQSKGIGIMGAFIVGFDDDDENSFKRIGDFIIDNNIFISQVTFLTPLPGTKLRERYKKENKLLENSWDKYGFLDINFKHKTMSKNFMIKNIISLYNRIYNKKVLTKKMRYFLEINKRLGVEKN